MYKRQAEGGADLVGVISDADDYHGAGGDEDAGGKYRGGRDDQLDAEEACLLYTSFVPGHFINITQPLAKRTAYLTIVKFLIFPLPFSGAGVYTVVWPQNTFERHGDLTLSLIHI